MAITREEISVKFPIWLAAWDNYDLEGVLDFMHNNVVFENWNGAIVHGKTALRRAWHLWFENHGNFKFFTEDEFFDEVNQKMTFQWRLEWPSTEKNFLGLQETRRGVDLLHFVDGKIYKKLTFSKTTLNIESKIIPLCAQKI
jgi:SnoaL-like domain